MIDWLLGTLLATAALALLVLLVREPVRKRFGSRVTYALWLIPAARLFMPTLTHIVPREVPAYAPTQPLTDPLIRDSLWMARVTPAEPSLVDRLGGWPTVLFAIWIAIALALFLSRMVAFHRDRRAILASGDEVGRIGALRIIRSSEIVSPVALGILRPIIVVPSDFYRLYGPRERHLVLEHELAHHRSGDLAANLFAFVLLCLQWFNPLAWVAHRAFRFDQEAACDARVLDKATAMDRADYGRAIAKAASGRALLFASALDRPTSLQRRLKSMLASSTPRRRLAGRIMVVGAVAAALPLTASHAVRYVDVAAPAPVSDPVPVTPTAAVVPPVAAAAVAAPPMRAVPPVAPQAVSPVDRDLSIHGDFISIDGKTKRWEELTPAEKAEVRRAVAKARSALASVHIDQAKLMRDVAAVQQIRLGDMQRQLAQSQASVAEAMRGVDASAPYLRWSGQDPEQIRSTIRTAMASVQAVDPRVIERAIGAVDQRKIADSIAKAQESMRAASAELDSLDARMRADPQH